MNNNLFHNTLTKLPHFDLLYRFIVWGLVGLTMSMVALRGQDIEIITQYVELVTKPSIKNLNYLGVVGIFLTLAALWFKNLEKVGGAIWKPNSLLHKIGLFVRRTANDILLSVFGLGATVAGLFCTLAWLMKGTPQEWLIFGLTVTQFLLIIGFIGFLNLVLRIDDSSPLISWQQKLRPPIASTIYLVTGIFLTIAITR